MPGRSQRGYADSIAISVIAGILVVIAVVYALSHLGHINAPTVTPTPTPSPTASSSSSPSVSASPQLHSSTAAFNQVKSFYAAYIQTQDRQSQQQLIQQYATSAILTKYNTATGGDPITCSQNPLSSVSYGLPAAVDQTAVMKVTRSVGGSPAPGSIQVTVRLSDLRISDISCQ